MSSTVRKTVVGTGPYLTNSQMLVSIIIAKRGNFRKWKRNGNSNKNV